MRASWAETIMGFAVLAFAALMLTYALGVSGLHSSGGYSEVRALARPAAFNRAPR
jgi:phospholipid/cholesterol/gamma-HCH transport system substrate-binding protein